MNTLRRIWGWIDYRLKFTKAFLPVIEHPVPRKVNWWYVFGSATLTAFVFQVITGVALAFTYVPAPNSAYDSLEFISHKATLGSVVRGIHYWGASAMVILIFVHVARVFLMGSYKFPRELNWLTGVGLLFLTLGMAFTGQLLRWDQDAYWAVVVGAEQAGRVPVIGHLLVEILAAGETVGGNTLTRFYATHVFLIPALMFLLIGAHLYLVVEHGISEPPTPGEPVDPATYEAHYHHILETDGEPFWPDAAWRDVVFALAIGTIVLILAIYPGPKELGKIADPTNLKVYPRPDWYFLWYFALLALIPPSIESWVMVGFPLVAAVVLIALPFVANKGERSPRRRPWAPTIVGLSVVAIAVLIVVGDRAPWSPVLSPAPLPANVIAAAQAQNVVTGATVFQTQGCINCHTIAGVGGKRGPDLTTVGNRLSDAQLTWRILNGGHNMPAFANTLTPSQLQAVVAFLSEQKGQPPPSNAASK